jgi:cytochrome c oxidase subunit 1
VLFGGSVFALFGGLYYWFPKMTGRMMGERLGKVHFWMMMLGFNATFGPMHILGLKGMPRRYYTYQEGLGWEMWNMLATMGAFTIAASTLVFMVNWVKSKRHGEIALGDPWDGRTLEWTIPSPPPEYNFRQVPMVTSVDDFWNRKYQEDRKGRPVRVPVGGAGEAMEETAPRIHMPSPSIYPLVAALGMPLMAYAVVLKSWFGFGMGVVVCLAGFYGWVLEPASAPEPEEPAHSA